jgi:hypothetical protein
LFLTQGAFAFFAVKKCVYRPFASLSRDEKLEMKGKLFGLKTRTKSNALLGSSFPLRSLRLCGEKMCFSASSLCNGGNEV